jgi:hypothetical protein
MNDYSKILPLKYNRMASITLIDYKKILAELEVTTALLDSNTAEYESLVDDIIHCRNITVNGVEFVVKEALKEVGEK